MEENALKSSIDADAQETNNKSPKERAIISKKLKEVISFGTNVYKELGNHAYHDKDAIARANGLSYFTIKPTLSTAQQYGILINKYGDGYKLTDLFLNIAHPKNDKEYKESIVLSLNASDMFKKLNEAFNNKRLPALQGIINTLIRDNSLKEAAATKVATIYIENLKDFGLIDSNGFVCLTPTIGSVENKHNSPDVGDTPPPPPPPPPNNMQNFAPPDIPNVIDVLIPLKGKRQAHLFIPDEYGDEDLVRIIKFVDALKNE